MATKKSPRRSEAETPRLLRGARRGVALLLLASFLLLVSSLHTWGAWTNTGGGTECTGTEEVSDTSVDCTVAATIEAGNVAIVWAATDNVDTADAETTLHSISDSAGNTYTKACEFTNGQGAAAAGATISVWFSKLSTELTSGVGVITLTTSTAVTDKVVAANEFTIEAGNVVSVEGACQTLANDGADAGSQTISGLTSQEYLFVRGIATESNGALSMTATTSYTLLSDGCINTTVGAQASDMGACGEFRIFTGTGDTSDPTLVDTTNDNASVYVALKEAAPPEPPAGQIIIIGSADDYPDPFGLSQGHPERKSKGEQAPMKSWRAEWVILSPRRVITRIEPPLDSSPKLGDSLPSTRLRVFDGVNPRPPRRAQIHERPR